MTRVFPLPRHAPRRHCERSEAIQRGIPDFRAACFWILAPSLQGLIRRSFSNRRTGLPRRRWRLAMTMFWGAWT